MLESNAPYIKKMEPEKRAKSINESEKRFKKLISLVGEMGEDQILPHILKLSNEVLQAEEELHKFIISTFKSAATMIPSKHFIYASVIAHIQSQQPALAGSILQSITSEFEHLLNSGEYTKSCLVLRLFGELSGLGSINQEFLSETMDQIYKLWKETNSDYYLGLLANAALINKSTVKEPYIAEIVDWTFSQRDTTRKDILKAMPFQQEDALESLVKMVQSNDLRQFTSPTYTEGLALEAISLSPFEVTYTDLCKYRPVLLVSNVDSYLLQTCREIMEAFKDSPQLTAEKLLNYDPLIVITGIFEGVLALPEPSLKLIQFSTIVQTLCELEPENKYEYLLEEFIRDTLPKIENSDLGAIENLAGFLAVYLMNNDLKFNWEILSSPDMTDRQFLFVKTLFEKISRLCDIEEFLLPEIPESLKTMLPKHAEPILRFAEIEESVDNTDCQLIIDRINSKANCSTMKSLLSSKEICNSGEFLQSIFCECVFYQGSKSMMHITTYLDRYDEILKNIPDTIILQALWSVWTSSQHRVILLVQKLLQMNIVKADEVATFTIGVFARNDTRNDYHRIEWEVLGLTVKHSADPPALLKTICDNAGNHLRLPILLRKNLEALRQAEVSSNPELVNKLKLI